MNICVSASSLFGVSRNRFCEISGRFCRRSRYINTGCQGEDVGADGPTWQRVPKGWAKAETCRRIAIRCRIMFAQEPQVMQEDVVIEGSGASGKRKREAQEEPVAVVVQPCGKEKRTPLCLSSVSLCLSRACLGKMVGDRFCLCHENGTRFHPIRTHSIMKSHGLSRRYLRAV